MTARKPLPPDIDLAGFTVRAALRSGASRARLDRHDLNAPFHGVRTQGESDSLIARCRALQSAFVDGTAFCGSTAARIWGLPLPGTVTGIPLRVSTLRPVNAMRRKNVVGTQRVTGRPVVRHGLRVLDPAATWLSLARELDVADLTAIADRLISGTLKQPALTTRQELAEALDAYGARPGCGRLRRALTDARERVWSRPETLLRLLIAQAGLPEPRPNFETDVDGGSVTIDLAWPQFRLAVEYDGRWHDQDPAQWAADGRRRERIVDAGWVTMHVRAGDLFGAPHALIARLVRRLRAGGFTLDGPIDLSHLPRYTP